MVEMDLKEKSNSPKGGEFARSFGKPNSVRKGRKEVRREVTLVPKRKRQR